MTNTPKPEALASLVERLNNPGWSDCNHHLIMEEAATTIETLSADLCAKIAQNSELAAERDALKAELAELHKSTAPEWFYLAGDMSSDRCRFSPWEVIDEDWHWDNPKRGSAVVQIETAVRRPDIWCAIRFFTDEEKDARGSDDDYELTEHATEAEARATLERTAQP